MPIVTFAWRQIAAFPNYDVNIHKINVLGKGRGEDVHFAKLTEADVLEMRRLRVEGCMVKTLSQKFGVHRDQVRNICTRKQWRHI